MNNNTIAINEEVVKLIEERAHTDNKTDILVDMPHGSSYLLSEFIVGSAYELSNTIALFLNFDIKGLYNTDMYWFASKNKDVVSIAAYFDSGVMHGMVQIPTYDWYSIVKPCLKCYIDEMLGIYGTKASSWYMDHNGTWNIPEFNSIDIPEFNLPF